MPARYPPLHRAEGHAEIAGEGADPFRAEERLAGRGEGRLSDLGR